MALFVVRSLTTGAVYDTVTTSPLLIPCVKFRTTVLPDCVTEVTAIAVPPARTEYADAGAVVAINASP